MRSNHFYIDNGWRCGIFSSNRARAFPFNASVWKTFEELSAALIFGVL